MVDFDYRTYTGDDYNKVIESVSMKPIDLEAKNGMVYFLLIDHGTMPDYVWGKRPFKCENTTRYGILRGFYVSNYSYGQGGWVIIEEPDGFNITDCHAGFHGFQVPTWNPIAYKSLS